MTVGRARFVVLLAATVMVYFVMVLWSLPRISALAGGAAPFDLRPFGYGLAEARSFLSALPEEGVRFYLDVQHRADAAYPALLAATLFFAIRALAPPGLPVPPWVVALVALPGMAFDYLENAAVAAMLRAGADGVTGSVVERASLWTVLKSAFATLAFAVLLAFVALAVWRRLAGRREPGQDAA